MAKAKPTKQKIGKPEEQKTAKPEWKLDWNHIEHLVRLLSRAGDDGVRLIASPEETLAEAQYLAELYQKAGKPLPDTLAALV